jgi:hypothetical protein
MYQIQQITSDPAQEQTLVLPDGTQIGFSMTYLPGQQIWNCNISYGSSFVLNGLQIVNNPNLLQQWKNIIPFGLGCFSTSSREPSQLSDFSSGYASLYILSSDDVATYTSALENGTASA